MAMGLHASSRGRGRSKRRAPMAEINVTPLVDVMLVLLIIFMVTAPLLASGVPIELPDSRANALDQQPDQVTIAIDREGFIYVDDSLVERGAFPAAVERIACGSRADAPLITLRADRTLDYGRVMAVMGELNRGGCNSISLVTQGSVEAP
jgi:biopolymer transport protein TolR